MSSSTPLSTKPRFAVRLAALAGFVGLGSVLGGCPIYDEDDRMYVDRPNTTGNACDSSYDCPNGYACISGSCSASGGGSACSKPSDCPSGMVCGTDKKCHIGTCTSYGCPSGYDCTLSGGAVTCTASSGPVDGGKVDAGPPPECTTNTTCVTKLGAGAKCLNGACVDPANQCSDATQCPGEAQCVDGVCTPTCSASKPCPTGYSCDTAKGVCTGAANSCNSTADCSGGNVCIGNRCVAPCTAGTCGAGLVCVGGGCIPNQKPNFVCQTEGVQGDCAKGSICLHHSCYIACGAADGGADAGSCAAADQFNQCKSVATSTGNYSVCGSTSNLGTECDPTRSLNCSGGKVCIDGFCR